jgi:glycerate-2-kinase
VTRAELRNALRRILRKGLSAVEPGLLIRAHVRVSHGVVRVAGVKLGKSQRVFLVSVGKAAVPMARAVHGILGERLARGIIIAPQKAPRMSGMESFASGHPLPDAAGIRAGRRVIRLLEAAGRDDVVLLLLSGGASALMPAPVKGVSLRDKRRLTRALLLRGASIVEINAVRKQLSRLKGGGFARLAAPARVICLALSDVPGNDVGAIGSGPTVDDPRARGLARETVRKFLRDDVLPEGVRRALRRPRARGAFGPGTQTLVIGEGRTFALAAAVEARKLGFRVRLLVDALSGEARVCGPALVARFAKLRGGGPVCLIATGETLVKVLGRGRGGRNQELALASVEALSSLGRPAALATLATDGKDGTSSASGGLVDDRTQKLAIRRGVSVQAALNRNDSNRALRRLGSLIETGPTGTNVADVTVLVR